MIRLFLLVAVAVVDVGHRAGPVISISARPNPSRVIFKQLRRRSCGMAVEQDQVG